MCLLGSGASGCGGETDERPAEWAYIAPLIIAPNCATASCHSKGAAVAGLDLSTADKAYEGFFKLSSSLANPLSNVTADDERCQMLREDPKCDEEDELETPYCQDKEIGARCDNPRPLITACVPSQSRVVAMLRAAGAVRMPPDRPLSEGDIRLIERWILAGARQDPDDQDPCAVKATPAGDAGVTP